MHSSFIQQVVKGQGWKKRTFHIGLEKQSRSSTAWIQWKPAFHMDLPEAFKRVPAGSL